MLRVATSVKTAIRVIILFVLKLPLQLFLFVFLLAQLCNAQEPMAEQGAGEEKILAESDFESVANKISQQIGLSDNIAGNFEQFKYISVLPNPLKSVGNFTYSKHEGLDWLTTQPISSRLTFNDEGIRQEMDGKVVWEIEAEQPAVATITRVIVSVLALDWRTLQDYFVVTAGFKDQAWQINLIPKEQAMLSIVNSLKVSGQNQLEKLVLFEANDDRTEIEFTFPSPQ